jgi:cytochrome P450
MTLPMPRTQPAVGHLGRWGRDPLGLLEEGARLGPVFGLRLWRRAIVGYSPAWNRFVLGDLTTFRSAGSLSGLSPYLGSGVVHLDAPAHQLRRRELNPAFARGSISALAAQVTDVISRSLPTGSFDAVAWSAALMRDILGAVFLGSGAHQRLLGDFLRPLDRAMPSPFLRRPVLFHRMDHVLRQRIAQAPAGTLAAAFRGLPDGVAELRVAISAGYDTTAHTLAWLLAHLAQQPHLQAPEFRSSLIDEVLRLYPAGWMGSRRCAADTEFGHISIPRGTLVLYSPYLTHRDPALWPEPLRFRPERFAGPVPAWGHIPFAAGERTCLGRSLARLVLDRVLAAMAGGDLRFIAGDLRPRAGITLAPSGALRLDLRRRPIAPTTDREVGTWGTGRT